MKKNKHLVALFDSPDLPDTKVPQWVANLLDAMGKAGEKQLGVGTDDEDSSETFGKAVGLWEASLTNLKQKPLVDGKQLYHSYSKELLQNIQKMQEQLPAQISEMQKEALDMPVEEKQKFFQGYTSMSKASETDAKGIPNWSTEAMPFYFVMILYWPVVDQMPSVTALHKFLCHAYPGQQISLERIAKICQRIGLAFRGRGRPKSRK